jgi:hypothetical protein
MHCIGLRKYRELEAIAEHFNFLSTWL